MTLRLVTSPLTAPVTLEEAKAQCEVDYDDRNTFITGLIAAAVSLVDGDGTLGRAMVTQTWAKWVGQSPSVVKITMGPFIALTGVLFYDTDGVLQTADIADFETRIAGDFVNIQPKNGNSWPATQSRDDAIKIEFTAGFGDASAVPADLKHALLLLVAYWFENREAASELTIKDIPMGVDALIGRHRVGWYG